MSLLALGRQINLVIAGFEPGAIRCVAAEINPYAIAPAGPHFPIKATRIFSFKLRLTP